MIKGTKEGLTVHLDDGCSFENLLIVLTEKLTVEKAEGPSVAVKVNVGNRYLTKEQEDQLCTLLLEKQNFTVKHIHSNVILREQAMEQRKKEEMTSISRIIRSGQVLKVNSDVLLIGDVNPGGTIIADGNILILGSLRGLAHAGYDGNKEAIIAASFMQPTQLRISDVLSRSPDYKTRTRNELECAYIDESGSIIIDRIQTLATIRPNFTKTERSFEPWEKQ